MRMHQHGKNYRIGHRELLAILPPKLAIDSLSWISEEYWDNSDRCFFAAGRNSYYLQIHKTTAFVHKRYESRRQVLSRWILQDGSANAIAWLECEEATGTFIQLDFLLGTADFIPTVESAHVTAALETLLFAVIQLLDADEILFTASETWSQSILKGWGLGDTREAWTPRIGILSSPSNVIGAHCQRIAIDIADFLSSELGQELHKKHHYLELRKERTINAHNAQFKPKRVARGILARIFRSRRP